MMSLLRNDPAAGIEKLINDYVVESPLNDLGAATAEKAFDAPLVGYSRGNDSLYTEYVAHIGDFYLTPLAIFQQVFPDQTGVRARDLTVISWILPATPAVRTQQAAQVRYPSERWIRVRYFGEKFNDALRGHVVASLKAAGIPALAPMGSPFWRRFGHACFR